MRSLRSWFSEDRARDVAPDYTSQILAQSTRGGSRDRRHKVHGGIPRLVDLDRLFGGRGDTVGPTLRQRCKDISPPSRDRWLTPGNPTGWFT